MSFNLQSWKQTGNHSCIIKDDYNGDYWYSGEVATPHGFVFVYSQGHDDPDFTATSSYRMIYGGRYFCASEDRARTPPGLAIMAGKFMREVVATA